MQGSQNRYWSETEPVDREVDFFISIWGGKPVDFATGLDRQHRLPR
jgi:hypothetical protein